MKLSTNLIGRYKIYTCRIYFTKCNKEITQIYNIVFVDICKNVSDVKYKVTLSFIQATILQAPYAQTGKNVKKYLRLRHFDLSKYPRTEYEGIIFIFPAIFGDYVIF